MSPILKNSFPLTFVFLFVVLIGALSFTELNINRTKSLPYSVFLTVKGLPYKEGDFVTIRNHSTRYFSDICFTKRVEGMEGDKTAPLLTDLKTHTKHSKPLTPLKAKTIPAGYVFVKANHPRSFDSRYEEFGLVAADSIIGKAFPLW